MSYDEEEIEYRRSRGIFAEATAAPISLEDARRSMGMVVPLQEALASSEKRLKLFKHHAFLCLSWASSFNKVVTEKRGEAE